MASTTKTTNLELSQFVGTDKPAWLTDYNGDMQKIDDGYKKLKDANTATQADLDATKQNLSGSQTDIADVKANVQALEAQDIAIGNRLTVLEGNYDTMHHEVAINQQDIADMKPYAMIAANRKTSLVVGTNVTRHSFDIDSIVTSIGVEDTNNDIERRILFGNFFENVTTHNKEAQLIMDILKPSDNYSITKTTNITIPAGGIHFEYIDDENVAIHMYLTKTKLISIKFGKTTGITFALNDNGSITQLFNIPVPVTP